MSDRELKDALLLLSQIETGHVCIPDGEIFYVGNSIECSTMSLGYDGRRKSKRINRKQKERGF